jgi:hypothetical protein
VVFPREFSGWASLDEHFWAQRRVVFGCVLAANAMVWILIGLLALADPAWAAFWTPGLLIGVAVCAACTATAAFAPSRPVVIGALLVVLAYTLWNMVRAGAILIADGAWLPATGA